MRDEPALRRTIADDADRDRFDHGVVRTGRLREIRERQRQDGGGRADTRDREPPNPRADRTTTPPTIAPAATSATSIALRVARQREHRQRDEEGRKGSCPGSARDPKAQSDGHTHHRYRETLRVDEHVPLEHSGRQRDQQHGPEGDGLQDAIAHQRAHARGEIRPCADRKQRLHDDDGAQVAHRHLREQREQERAGPGQERAAPQRCRR